jgi:SGNH domain (fused to AT3 domains)/Acyltransferase family
MHLPYRCDIDGLRAFAVTSVLIFHAFPSLIPGGFVGVDVFFVISGFLISGIIFKELETGSFSFANFYARRVKRIFPALITMLTASYAFGWFFLFNEVKQSLAKTIDALVRKGWFIYLTDDTPKFGFDSARCKFNNPFTGKSQCSEDSNFYFSIRSSYLPILQEEYFSRRSNVGFIDLSNSFCADGHCFMGKNNDIYFRDNNHLNVLGSSVLGKNIREQIAEDLQRLTD